MFSVCNVVLEESLTEMQVSDVYKKFRFTLRFLLGNLHDFDVIADAVDFEALPLADRYMLHRLGKLLDDVKTSYGGFQFYRTYQVPSLFRLDRGCWFGRHP